VTQDERSSPDQGSSADDLIESQVERTEMAWARTALTSAGLLLVSAHLSGADTSLVAALVVGMVVAAPGLVASWWRIRGLRARPEPDPPRAVSVALLVGSVVLVDLVVLVMLVR
jgi:uncharacterized membrane protein YidH (DUF202 family)